MSNRYLGLKRWQWIFVVSWVGFSIISMPPPNAASLMGRFVGAFVGAYLIVKLVIVVYGVIKRSRQAKHLQDLAEDY